MTFDECWAQFVAKNKMEKVSRLALSIEEFRRVLHVAFDEGRAAGRAEGADSLRAMMGDDPLKAMFGK